MQWWKYICIKLIEIEYVMPFSIFYILWQIKNKKKLFFLQELTQMIKYKDKYV